MKDNDVSGQAGEEWSCEHVRVTIFTLPFQIDDAKNWWSNVTGEPPVKSTVEQRFGKRTDEGLYRGENLSLTIQPARIEWVLSADMAQTMGGGGFFPSIGSLGDSLKVMGNIIEKWLGGQTPPIVRMAVGTAVMLPIADRAAGYRNLQHFLPSLQIDTENSREFLYQINRPRKSDIVTELEINRLCRWTVAAFMFQSLVIGQTAVAPSVKAVACRIEPDVNTDGDRNEPLPPEKLLPLYNELVTLASELVEKGDIA